MKLLQFDDSKLGVLKGEGESARVVDVSPAVEAHFTGPSTSYASPALWTAGFTSRHLALVITQWEALRPAIEQLAASAEGVPLASVTLLAPVPRPGNHSLPADLARRSELCCSGSSNL